MIKIFFKNANLIILIETQKKKEGVLEARPLGVFKMTG